MWVSIFRKVVLPAPIRGNITVTQTNRRSRLPLKVRGARGLGVMDRNLIWAWEYIAKRHIVLRIFLTATVLLGLAVPSWNLSKKLDAGKGTVKVGDTLSQEESKPEQPSAELSGAAEKKLLDYLRREEMAAALEGDLRGAGEVFDDGKLRITPMVQIGTTASILMLIPSNQLESYFKPFP